MFLARRGGTMLKCFRSETSLSLNLVGSLCSTRFECKRRTYSTDHRGKIVYTRITPDRINEVIEHQKRSFFFVEPLGHAMNLRDYPESLEIAINYSRDTAAEGRSIMALNENNQVIAAMFSGTLKPGDMEKKLAYFKEHPPKRPFDKIVFLVASTLVPLNLFERFGVDEIFELRMGSVDKEYLGLKISETLLKISEQIARDDGFKVFMGEATNHYMAKICMKNGFEKIHEVRYDSVLDENGNMLIPVKPPHEYFHICVKTL